MLPSPPLLINISFYSLARAFPPSHLPTVVVAMASVTAAMIKAPVAVCAQAAFKPAKASTPAKAPVAIKVAKTASAFQVWQPVDNKVSTSCEASTLSSSNRADHSDRCS